MRIYDEVGERWITMDRRSWSDDHGSEADERSLTQQHMREEVDVNTIVKRFGITGQMPFGNASGLYGDFTGITDFDSALERIEMAQDKFMKLPPDVREKFDNDPAKLIAFASSLPEAEFVAMFEEVKPADEEVKPAEPAPSS